MNTDEKLCTNCNANVPVQNFATHLPHCTRRIVRCSRCNEPVSKERLSEHLEREHTMANCQDCGTGVQGKSLLQEHLQKECCERSVVCPHCELDLPARDMDVHSAYCGTRTERCTECGEFVMLKYKQLHLDSNHNFVKLDDEPGPSASWKQKKNVPSSSTNASSQDVLLPCEFCNGTFTMNELLRHQTSCFHGWRTVTPLLRKISTMECTTCYKTIASAEFEAHHTFCRKSPSRESKNENLIPCEVCGMSVAFEEYEGHFCVRRLQTQRQLRNDLADLQRKWQSTDLR
ncbi:XIAP-associated factor 1 isoform X2 [Cephus cinctus]|uniref:XIAP-associated factor 1 isoform X2 n=1 Tax=Cephus cinctus TaxID=211228 RepID=A0AAJ7CE67_CEPCN|nr:XIAP-associated factor 1 isoform X2 [Cephus cinctus]